jgi:two-component system, cell cycle response regulator
MKILIAEDDPHQARQLDVLVRSWGYDPVVVHDGLSAVRALHAPDSPRLVLLDWVLPGLDGIRVCREVREEQDRPYTYVVLVTGQGGRPERLAGLEAGADDFLAKPVDPPELRARLNAGRRILILQEQLLTAQRRLEEQATRDGLTGLWNRAAVLDLLTREFSRAGREGAPLGLLMADLDHFKRINDTHGHLTGDRVLRQAARRLRAELRPYDGVGRYGGEEFVVVLPGCNGPSTLRLAERLRRGVAGEPVDVEGGPLSITMSVGAAWWGGQGAMDSLALLRVADEALYSAKRAGRNRAVLVEATAAGYWAPGESGAEEAGAAQEQGDSSAGTENSGAHS